MSTQTASLKQQILNLETRFWIVNTMEMIERLAYYGVRAVIAIYMVLAVEKGGPEFTHVQKGAIFATWAAWQSLLPMFTGGLADRFGHKKTISVAIVLKICGYLFMAWFKDYTGFFIGCMLLAIGTAIFKPGVQGTLAATLKKSEASVGWSIFYQLVNIGGFLGPVIAGVLRQWSWAYVFYGCAVIVAANFLWLPFYKDPSQDADFADDAAQRVAWGSLSRAMRPSLLTGWMITFGVISGVLSLALLGWAGTLLGEAGTIDASSLGVEALGLLGGPLFALGWSGVALALTAGGLALLRGGSARSAWVPVALAALLIWVGTNLTGGGWLQPLSAHSLGEDSLIASAGGVALALLKYPVSLLLFLVAYAPRKAALDEGRSDFWAVVLVSVVGIFQHRVIWFCLVFAGFWVMFNQVFDLLPNVIDDWVDSSMVIGLIGDLFANPTVPTLLAIFLGAAWGFVTFGIQFLALRWDRRAAADVPLNAAAVVGLVWAAFAAPTIGSALFGAGEGVSQLLLGALSLVGLLGGTALITGLKPPGRPVALGVGLLTGVAAFVVVRRAALANSDNLVQMAADGAQLPPEWMINMNPGLIVFTVVFFGYLSSFVKPLTSIVIGMTVATVGSVVAGTATGGWLCLAGIAVFSIGEMLSSPKKMEYLATLAEKGQEGLFMGYANVPVAIGWIAGSLIAGSAYEENGDKVNLARRHLVDVLGADPGTVEALPKSEVMDFLAGKLGGTVMDAQHLLFDTYQPWTIWLWIGATGLASIVGMLIYDRVLRTIDGRKAA